MENFLEIIKTIIINVSIFVLVIGTLVSIHEFGHFLAAKIVGAKVLEFSLGIGPKILSKKFGETLFKLCIFPIGGYVKILGEVEDKSKRSKRSLSNKSPIQRIIVMLAGITMNLIFASILYYILFSTSDFKMYLSRELNTKIIAGEIVREKLSDEIKYVDLVVDGGMYNANAPKEGTIKSIDGKVIDYSDEIGTYLKEKANQTVIMNICDKEKCNDYEVKVNQEGKVGVFLGSNYIYALNYQNNKIVSGFIHPLNMIRISFDLLSNIFSNAKQTGDYSTALNTVSGPVGIYLAIDEIKKYGISAIISLLADLSVGLAFMNLLPIPALDGGRVFLILPELITGKKINKKFETILISTTYIILLIFTVLIAIKDFVYIEVLRSLLK